MPMGITETGHHAAPLQVNHARGRSTVFERIGGAPHHHQPAVAHGKGLRPRTGGVSGPDLGIGVNRIGDRGR